MASNHEGSDFPDPEFGEGDSRRDKLFDDFDKYLADITEVGGAEAYYAEATRRGQGASAGDDESVIAGSDGDEPFGGDETDAHADEVAFAVDGEFDTDLDDLDPFKFWEKDGLGTELGDELADPVEAARGAVEHTVTSDAALGTLRDRSRAQLSETADATGEADKVKRISQQTEAKVIELVDVPNRGGIAYSQAMADMSRFAHGQEDLESVRAVQVLLEKLPDNGTHSGEYTDKKRSLATAYYDGLSLGDVESAEKLDQLLGREKQEAEEKGGLAKGPITRGPAIIQITEECHQRGLSPEAYVNRYVEGADAQWAVNFMALKNVVEEASGNHAAAGMLQEHLRVLAQQEGFSDEYLAETIPQVVERAIEPGLKASLLDRFHMVSTYRKDQTYENFRQMYPMAELLLEDDRFMQTHPDDFYYLSEHIQSIAQTRLHERSNSDGTQREAMLRASGELSVATMVWGNNSPDNVAKEIESRRAVAVDVLETVEKKYRTLDPEGNLSADIRESVAQKVEGQVNGMRAMAALQFFRRGNYDACNGMLASITNAGTQLDSYSALWSNATPDQIVQTTPPEVVVPEDPDSHLVEVYETAMAVASNDPEVIAARFETLSNAVSEAGEDSRGRVTDRVKSQYEQSQQLFGRLMQLDMSLATPIARNHLPKRMAGHIGFRRQRDLEPFYDAITSFGSANSYAEVAGYIDNTPGLQHSQKVKQLARYAVKLQGVARVIRALESPEL